MYRTKGIRATRFASKDGAEQVYASNHSYFASIALETQAEEEARRESRRLNALALDNYPMDRLAPFAAAAHRALACVDAHTSSERASRPYVFHPQRDEVCKLAFAAVPLRQYLCYNADHNLDLDWPRLKRDMGEEIDSHFEMLDREEVRLGVTNKSQIGDRPSLDGMRNPIHLLRERLARSHVELNDEGVDWPCSLKNRVLAPMKLSSIIRLQMVRSTHVDYPAHQCVAYLDGPNNDLTTLVWAVLFVPKIYRQAHSRGRQRSAENDDVAVVASAVDVDDMETD
jgi:hypothetical protein